jgi:SAM-dependent methyltransferase
VLARSRELLKSRLRKFWNAQEEYWSYVTEEIATSSEVRARAASFVPVSSRVLDVACGRAANCVWLLERTQYFGADLSLNGLRHAQREGLRLTCADAEALPFMTGCFDAALATYALEHSANPVQMLSEMTRVVRPGGRVILLGPCWDYPFWYPNSLLTKARSPLWRLRYTGARLLKQFVCICGGPSPFVIVEEPDAFTQPFVYDADAVYVAWSYEIIRQMRRWGLRLVLAEADNKLLGRSPVVRLLKRVLMLLPAYRYAGSTILMVFEKC